MGLETINLGWFIAYINSLPHMLYLEYCIIFYKSVFNLECTIAPLTPFQSNWRIVEVRRGRIGAVRILRGKKI